MAVSSTTPTIQYTGNNSNTDFAFTFVVPALQTGNTITDATASISSGSTTLTVTTADFFYTSSLQGKSITVNGAGVGGANLETTINTRTSGTVVELVDAASTTVSNATITVTTGAFGTAMKNTGDLEVFVDGVLQTITTHYTVLLNVGDDSNKGGTVQFVTAPATDAVVTIVRDVELSRTVDFQRGGALTSKDLNAEFDNIVMAVQDNIATGTQALKFPADELVSVANSTLPSATSRANKLVAFNSSGVLNLTSDITSGDGNVSANVITANTATITNITGTLTGDVTGDVTGTVSSLANQTTSNLAEGSNLYFTTARSTTQFNTDLASKDTGDLAEGSNLYYTNARADARIGAASIGDLSDVDLTGVGNTMILSYNTSTSQFEPVASTLGISAQAPLVYNSATATLSLPNLSTFTTSDLTEGTNLYYTDTRFDTRLSTKTADDVAEGSTNKYFSGKTTTDLAEGTNLYYTDARAQAVSINNLVEDTTPQLGGDLDLNSNNITGTGGINITGTINNGSSTITTGSLLGSSAGALSIQPDSNNFLKLLTHEAQVGETGGLGASEFLMDKTTATLSGETGLLKLRSSVGNIELNAQYGSTSSTDRGVIKLDAQTEIEIAGSGIIDTTNGLNTLRLQSSSGNGSVRILNPVLAVGNSSSSYVLSLPSADGSNGQVLATDGSGQLSFVNNTGGGGIALTDLSVGSNASASGSGGIAYNNSNGEFTYTPPDTTSFLTSETFTSVVQDTTPQLGGSLDVNGQIITSTSNGDIKLQPNGTGEVRLDTDITELHSTKGLIIHDGAQGTYLDLTGGGGANHSALYGAGVHAEETNGGAQLSLFSHKSNGATAYPNLWAHRSRDNNGSKDFLNNDDIIFSFFGAAYDGGHGGGEGTFRKTASVELKASENHSASNANNGNGGGKIEFHTVDNGTLSYAGTKRLTIDDNIELNTPLDVNGQTITSSSNGNIIIEPNGTGHVGIGETSPDTLLHVKKASSGTETAFSNSVITLENDTDCRLQFLSGSSNVGEIMFGDGNLNRSGRLSYDHNVDAMKFETVNAERMRIASDGKLMINTTSDLGNSQGVLHVKGKTSNNIARFGAGSNGEEVVFVNASDTQVGSIMVNSSSTSYNTSSDYRLKENIDYDWDATTRLKQLKPARFNFIADADETVDGFIAHEVSNVVPEAISGEKDAMAVETRYTADDVETQGETPSKNVGDPKTYSTTEIDAQSIDQSKLVPLLVKTIQELEARITDLENGQ